MKKANLYFVIALACTLLAGCTSQPKTTVEKIEVLRQQVRADANTLQEIASNDFEKIQTDFRYCDSLLQYLDTKQVDEYFDQLNLTKAYILQFKETKPVMEKKIDYVLLQLDHLESDAESHYLTDSLVLVYLDTENKVADTLHAQVDYFKTRFSNCQKELDKLKKSSQR